MLPLLSLYQGPATRTFLTNSCSYAFLSQLAIRQFIRNDNTCKSMRLMGKQSSNFLIFMQYFWVCWLASKNSYLEPPLTKYCRRRPPPSPGRDLYTACGRGKVVPVQRQGRELTFKVCLGIIYYNFISLSNYWCHNSFLKET